MDPRDFPVSPAPPAPPKRTFQSLCDLLPSEVNWGDALMPDTLRHILDAYDNSKGLK